MSRIAMPGSHKLTARSVDRFYKKTASGRENKADAFRWRWFTPHKTGQNSQLVLVFLLLTQNAGNYRLVNTQIFPWRLLGQKQQQRD